MIERRAYSRFRTCDSTLCLIHHSSVLNSPLHIRRCTPDLTFAAPTVAINQLTKAAEVSLGSSQKTENKAR